jgi:CCR4-NOT transcription complex subunit 2
MQGFLNQPSQPSTVIGYRPRAYQEPQPQVGQENEPPSGVGSAALLESPPQKQPAQAPIQRPAQQKRLAEMTDMERWGIPGLLAMFNRDHPDFSEMSFGTDLSALGLDLSSNSPLYPTFGVPFDNAGPRPVIPDFHLPVAYAVNNVPPLEQRIQNFTDDTLFAIFYQYPRDVKQELAAQELYNRDWRWHKDLRQWMMKDATLPPPQRLTAQTERGFYIFFDATNWKRDRVCFSPPSR